MIETWGCTENMQNDFNKNNRRVLTKAIKRLVNFVNVVINFSKNY